MMNVLISVDKNYLDSALTMLFSLRRYVHEEITVYLLNHSLSAEDIDYSAEYLRKKCSILLQCINVKNKTIDHMPVVAHFSVEMYYRIFAQFFLPDSIERVLWLDADIIVLKDISSFYHQSFDGKKYIVASDYGVNSFEYWKAHRMKLGLPDEYEYFNSGVMLMNLKCLRKETSEETILKAIEAIRDELILPDQDVLNCLYQEDVKYVDWRVYNFQYGSNRRIDSDELQKIAILHYVSGRKPWKYWNITSDSKHYWKVRVQQGFWLEAIDAHWRQIKELTYVYITSVCGVLKSILSCLL